jgi:DNA-binding MarR family transcriptional regulator
MDINHFRNVINFIRKEIYMDFPLPQLEVFLLVIENDGISQSDISKRLDMPQGTVSRNVAKLSSKVIKKDDGSYEKVGYGLLENRPDQIESRSYNVFLTDKGKQFVKDLKFVLKEDK